MKKNDIILVAVILLVGVLFLLFVKLSKQEGSKVRVLVDGKVYKELSLKEDTSFTVELDNGDWNTFVIKDGYVDMIEANCPDELCVRSPNKIRYNHETITCLPHNVILQIAGGEENDVDAVAK
jgi:hypothetical protein